MIVPSFKRRDGATSGGGLYVTRHRQRKSIIDDEDDESDRARVVVAAVLPSWLQLPLTLPVYFVNIFISFILSPP